MISTKKLILNPTTYSLANAVQIQGKEYSVQFKTREYLSKKEFMDDITIRDLDCLYGRADLLIESVYDESSGAIVDQHFLDFKKLGNLIDKKLLIDGRGSSIWPAQKTRGRPNRD